MWVSYTYFCPPLADVAFVLYIDAAVQAAFFVGFSRADREVFHG
jgi:hypothetical protein